MSFVVARTDSAWLAIFEGLVYRMVRAMPRHVRIAVKEEPKVHIAACTGGIGRQPVMHTRR